MSSPARVGLDSLDSVADQESFAQEFRLSGLAMDDRLHYQLGMLYAKDDLAAIETIFLAESSILYGRRNDAASAAGIWQLVWDLNAANVSMAGTIPFLPASMQEAVAAFDAMDQVSAAAVLHHRPTDQDIADAGVGFRDWQNINFVESETLSLFAHAEYELSQNWGLEVGVRYSETDMSARSCTRDVNGDNNIHSTVNFLFYNPVLGGSAANAPEAGQCGTLEEGTFGSIPFGSEPVAVDGYSNSLDERNTSARLVLDYQASEDLMLYSSVARGFKAGAFNTTSSFVSTQLEPVKQEKVVSYELGAKWSVSDNLQLNASAYYYDYTNKQLDGTIPDPVFTTLTTLVNVPKSKVQGLEADVTWAPTENWFTSLNLSYLETEITKYNGYSSATGEPLDFSGSEFARAPNVQVTGLLSYRHSINPDWGLQANFDVSYTGEQYADFGEDPLFVIDAYTLLGASLNVFSEDGLWESTLWVKNLTDEYYWSNVSAAIDFTQRTVGSPRTWGLNIKRNFF